MVNREMKLAIGDGLQTLFHPIVNATKQAAEETRKELTSMKKTLTNIDEALNHATVSKNIATTLLRLGEKEKILTVDDTEYTPGLHALLTSKQPQPSKWNSNDYREYKSLVAQTKVRSFPNRTGNARPHTTWKWKLKKMAIYTERISEESGDAYDINTASIVDVGGSPGIPSPDYGIPQSPAHTRS